MSLNAMFASVSASESSSHSRSNETANSLSNCRVEIEFECLGSNPSFDRNTHIMKGLEKEDLHSWGEANVNIGGGGSHGRLTQLNVDIEDK